MGWRNIHWIELAQDRTDGWILWMRQRTIGLHTMREFLWLAENGVASEEELCSIELVSYADIFVYAVVVFQITKILKSLPTVLYSSRLCLAALEDGEVNGKGRRRAQSRSVVWFAITRCWQVNYRLHRLWKEMLPAMFTRLHTALLFVFLFTVSYRCKFSSRLSIIFSFNLLIPPSLLLL